MDFPKRITIRAKPNSPKTEIVTYDDEKKAYKVNVHAPPEGGKANIEIVKFFSKLTKKKVRIVSGLTSKEKVLVFA
jgi:uncharacterized protein (TIGR00251 family)